MEEICIKILRNGQVEINVKGIKGKACKALTAELEKNLGAVIQESKTAEYYVKPVVRQPATAGTGKPR